MPTVEGYSFALAAGVYVSQCFVSAAYARGVAIERTDGDQPLLKRMLAIPAEGHIYAAPMAKEWYGKCD